jgi:ABC-type microcin C transport system duplicated ATPase subunit YejF
MTLMDMRGLTVELATPRDGAAGERRLAADRGTGIGWVVGESGSENTLLSLTTMELLPWDHAYELRLIWPTGAYFVTTRSKALRQKKGPRISQGAFPHPGETAEFRTGNAIQIPVCEKW